MPISSRFKPGNIITNFKEPTWHFRPAKEWIHNINIVSATWKVISIEPNGDYKLQRLDTLDLTPLTEKNSPEHQKARMSKEAIDDDDAYKLWDKNDVTAVYNSALAKVNVEKRVKDSRLEAYNKEMATMAPLIKEYFKNKNNNSIEATANKFRLDNEEVWNVLDENELKGAKDYDLVKENLFGEDDDNFKNFETVTQDVLKYNQKNALNKVLGNRDLTMTIGEYFRTSKKKGGKKSKKRKTKRSKKRETKRSIKRNKKRKNNTT